MTRLLSGLALTGLALFWHIGIGQAQSPQTPAPPRPAPGEAMTLAVQCRQAVERKHAPGTLSRNRHERQQLIDACIANGGILP